MEKHKNPHNMGFICLFTLGTVASAVLCMDNSDPFFAKKMVAAYGTNGTLSVEQLKQLLHTLQFTEKEEHGHGSSHSEAPSQAAVNGQHGETCRNITQSSPDSCLTSKVSVV